LRDPLVERRRRARRQLAKGTKSLFKLGCTLRVLFKGKLKRTENAFEFGIVAPLQQGDDGLLLRVEHLQSGTRGGDVVADFGDVVHSGILLAGGGDAARQRFALRGRRVRREEGRDGAALGRRGLHALQDGGKMARIHARALQQRQRVLVGLALVVARELVPQQQRRRGGGERGGRSNVAGDAGDNQRGGRALEQGAHAVAVVRMANLVRQHGENLLVVNRQPDQFVSQDENARG
jgi:hypothetical protein